MAESDVLVMDVRLANGKELARVPSILQRVAAGDSAAVDECLAQYGGIVWSMARKSSPTRQDAEDAVQDIFLDIWRNAARFDPSRASEVAFVALLARRRLIDRFRRGKRFRTAEPILSDSLPGDSGDPAESTGFELCDEATRAREALKKLRPDERQVLLLSIDKGLTHQEIARQLDMALGTVKSHARRGLIRLRELMDRPTASAAASVEIGGAQ